MRTFYIVSALLSTLLLASFTALAQTQSRDIRTIRLLPREKYGDTAYQTRRSPVVPGSFPRKSLGELSNSTDNGLLPGQAPKGGGGALAQNEGVLTNLDDVPRIDDPVPQRVKKSAKGRQGGAFYSFSLRTHETGYGSDIQLSHGQLQTGFGGADYGFLTNLGDVPLETVSVDTLEAKPLAAYARATREPDARLEYRRFREGAEIEGVKVKSPLPVQLNSTYLLRAVNYNQADVLVAFRVVNIESDGSAIINWKLLKKYRTPQLAPKHY